MLEDATGRRFDDWVAGFGSLNFGHNPAFVHRAIAAHLATNVPSLFIEALNPFAGRLAARLVRAAGPSFDTAFLCNSGSEAVETALKAACRATGRSKIVYADKGYHGTTLGALGCMAKGAFRDPFAELLPAFVEVPFGEVEALERALAAHDVAAFLLEPVQVEAGVRIATPAYLERARRLCSDCGALLIFDEVQTGMGRTGALFAFHALGTVPDIFALAKALGGGIVPIGAAVMGKGIWSHAYGTYLTSEIHNSTFGGNSLCTAVGIEALEHAADPNFLAAVRGRAEMLFSELRAALSGMKVVVRIRNLGLLGGIELRELAHPWTSWESLGLPELEGHPTNGPLLVERLARHEIFANVCAHDWSVLRVEPPLTVSEDACRRFVDAVVESVRWLEQNG